MINFNYNGIKNTLASFAVFNINLEINFSNKAIELVKLKKTDKVTKAKPKDYKTTLGGARINLIEKLNGDLVTYLFIEKNKIWEHNTWNMVVPVIIESKTKVIYQYTNGNFALEGSGTGLGSTRSILRYLKLHMDKGFNVSIIPKVIDNNLLHNFKFVDSDVDLDMLLKKSIDLILYRKNEFEWIYRQYKELLYELKIEK